MKQSRRRSTQQSWLQPGCVLRHCLAFALRDDDGDEPPEMLRKKQFPLFHEDIGESRPRLSATACRMRAWPSVQPATMRQVLVGELHDQAHIGDVVSTAGGQLSTSVPVASVMESRAK